MSAAKTHKPAHGGYPEKRAGRKAEQLLARIVDQYDAAPDGPLGKGFTNGPFLDARQFIKRPIHEYHGEE